SLRAHPQPFEKFADAAVEDVFVHDRLLCGAYFMWGQPKKPNPEDDKATVAPLSSVMNSRRFTARSSRASDWKDSTPPNGRRQLHPSHVRRNEMGVPPPVLPAPRKACTLASILGPARGNVRHQRIFAPSPITSSEVLAIPNRLGRVRRV